MQRRKFIAAMGSLAAGGAAATGTGAFTSVSADRNVSVNVAGDSSAMLKLSSASTPNANDYVSTSSNSVSIDLTGTDDINTVDGANGINDDAESKFANLLNITNLGTQDIQVGVDDQCEFIQNIGGVFAEGPDTNTGSNGNPNYPDPDDDGDQDSGAGFSIQDSPVSLEPGDTVENISLDINESGTQYIKNNTGPFTLRIVAVADDRYSQKYSGNPNDN